MHSRRCKILNDCRWMFTFYDQQNFSTLNPAFLLIIFTQGSFWLSSAILMTNFLSSKEATSLHWWIFLLYWSRDNCRYFCDMLFDLFRVFGFCCTFNLYGVVFVGFGNFNFIFWTGYSSGSYFVDLTVLIPSIFSLNRLRFLCRFIILRYISCIRFSSIASIEIFISFLGSSLMSSWNFIIFN